MSTTQKEDPANKTVEIVVNGKVTKDDYNRIAGQLESFISTHGRIKVLEVIRDFKGIDPAVIVEGIKFDIKHLNTVQLYYAV